VIFELPLSLGSRAADRISLLCPLPVPPPQGLGVKGESFCPLEIGQRCLFPLFLSNVLVSPAPPSCHRRQQEPPPAIYFPLCSIRVNQTDPLFFFPHKTQNRRSRRRSRDTPFFPPLFPWRIERCNIKPLFSPLSAGSGSITLFAPPFPSLSDPLREG